MFANASVEGVSLETIARDGNYEICNCVFKVKNEKCSKTKLNLFLHVSVSP